MKILTRRIGESLIIDDEIELQIAGIRGNLIRFKISLPEHMSMKSDEIFLKLVSDLKKSDLSY